MTTDIAELGRQLKPKNLRKADELPAHVPVTAVKVEPVGGQMVFFPEMVGAMPTEITRTSLFALIPRKEKGKTGERRVYQNVKLESRIDVHAVYEGPVLDQGDETRWMAALRLCRDVRLGERKYMLVADVLHDLNLSDTKANREALAAGFDRLSKSSLTIEFMRRNKKVHVVTGLMKWGYETDPTKGIGKADQIYMRLDPDGAQIFENMAYQPWDVRTALKGPASMALMTYASGQPAGKNHCVNLAELKRYLGYEGPVAEFRRQIRSALAELEQHGFFRAGKSGLKGGGRLERTFWMRTNAKKTISATEDEQPVAEPTVA